MSRSNSLNEFIRIKKTKWRSIHDCIVIGAGPAGSIAALYLKRFHRRVLLIDRGDCRALPIPLIRNLVGYSEGISGHDLLKKLHKQLLRFDTPFLQGEAQIFRRRNQFEVRVKKRTFFSKYVILATGFKDKQPEGIDFVKLCRQGALAYCPICDAYDHSDQTIGVLVDSSEGFRKIEFLFGFTPRLHLIILKKFRIPARHLEKVRKFKVQVHQGDLVSLRYDSLKKMLVVQLKNQSAFEVKMAYVAMGFMVSCEAIRHLKNLKHTKEGLIIVDDHQQTSIPGLYAVGDCVKSLAQISVGIGHAAIAATRIHNLLNH